MIKHFLDDIFCVFNMKTKTLQRYMLLNEINLSNPNIRLTMNHTSIPEEQEKHKCDCEPKSAIPFFDTLCSIKEGRIDIEPTDRNQYLLPSSCHQKQTTLAIPRSLAIRIVRICSDPNTRDQRLHELQDQLLERGYKKEYIESAKKTLEKNCYYGREQEASICYKI